MRSNCGSFLCWWSMMTVLREATKTTLGGTSGRKKYPYNFWEDRNWIKGYYCGHVKATNMYGILHEIYTKYVATILGPFVTYSGKSYSTSTILHYTVRITSLDKQMVVSQLTQSPIKPLIEWGGVIGRTSPHTVGLHYTNVPLTRSPDRDDGHLESRDPIFIMYPMV